MRSISFCMASLSRLDSGRHIKMTDAAVEHHECVAKSSRYLIGSTFDSGRVGNTPVGSQRLSWPNGTHLLRGVVTNREYEVQFGRPRLRELFPALTAQSLGGQASRFELLQRLRVHKSGRMAARAIGDEIGEALTLQNGLGHD